MTRAIVTLNGPEARAKAVNWVNVAPAGTRVEFRQVKRTLPQNSKLWASLTDIAQQVEWHGMRLSTDDWKVLFLDALNREYRMVPNLDNNGFVALGKSSSALSVSEMADLIEIIHAFGAKHGVKFQNDQEAA